MSAEDEDNSALMASHSDDGEGSNHEEQAVQNQMEEDVALEYEEEQPGNRSENNGLISTDSAGSSGGIKQEEEDIEEDVKIKSEDVPEEGGSATVSAAEGDGSKPIEFPKTSPEEKVEPETMDETPAVDEEGDPKVMDLVRQKVFDRLLTGEEEEDEDEEVGEENAESGDDEGVEELEAIEEEGDEGSGDSSSDSGPEEGSSSDGESGERSESSRASGERRKRSRAESRTDSRNRSKASKRSSPHRSSSVIDLNFFYDNARFYLIKSANQENVSLSKAKGVWATTAKNEANLNRAFRSASNVILIFSVERSQAFQGFARLSSESTQDHSPVQWVLPPGLNARNLGGIFRLNWLNRSELPFMKTMSLLNPWNENKPVKIGRDGTEIQPRVAEKLCSFFPSDRGIDLDPIIKKVKRHIEMNPVKVDRRPPPPYSRGPRPGGRGGGGFRERPPGREFPPRRDFGGGRWTAPPRDNRDRRHPAGRDAYGNSSGYAEYPRNYGGGGYASAYPLHPPPVSIFEVPGGMHPAHLSYATGPPPQDYMYHSRGGSRAVVRPPPMTAHSDPYRGKRRPSPRRFSPPPRRGPPSGYRDGAGSSSNGRSIRSPPRSREGGRRVGGRSTGGNLEPLGPPLRRRREASESSDEGSDDDKSPPRAYAKRSAGARRGSQSPPRHRSGRR